ncbi:MAG: hypothetical protein MIO90_05425 [Methanomassiliicoccales archaeon]|nr:hypothetical protein [Methanomassiliicoccales archaeon]
MPVSVGLNCPSCGGAIQVSEGENVLNCNYCGSLLWAEGDAGVMTVAYKNNQGRESVLRATEAWWKKGLKARDLSKKGRLLECYPIYLPFWSTTTRVAGWICGYEERHYTDRNGNTRTERIPKEEMVLRDYNYTNIACDPGDLGIKHLRNTGGEASFADFESIPTFESTTSKDDMVRSSEESALHDARIDANVPHITFEKVTVIPKRISQLYYPVWVVRYAYGERMYMATVDGVTGNVLSGRAPGDPLYQSLAVTGGTSAGGLIAAAGLAFGIAAEEMAIALGGLVIGAVILGFTYMFFRHGSEIIEGDFDDKKVVDPIQGLKDLQVNMGGFRI